MVDYQAAQPAPTQQHINDFITEVTQPGGPMEAAFDYLKQQGSLPPSVVRVDQFLLWRNILSMCPEHVSPSRRVEL